MAAIVYFVSEDDIKKYTPVSLNVETSIIKKAIIDAQQINIQQVLGSLLYKKIDSLVVGGPAVMNLPVNANYKTLFDEYIFNCTIHWTLVEILPYARFKIMNVGVNTQNSDNSTTAGFDEFKYVSGLLKNKAEFFTTRMKDYLVANYTLFPEYSYCDSKCDGELPADKNTYFNGIEFY